MNRLEEQRSRVLALFDEQARTLRRLTLFFLIPALLFGVFIFLPFTEQVASASRIGARLDSTRVRLPATADSLRRIVAVDSLLDALRLQQRLRHDLDARLVLAEMLTQDRDVDPALVEAWTGGQRDVDLRDIPRLASLLPGDPLRSDCVWLDDRRWRECFDVTFSGRMLCIGRGCFIYPDLVAFLPGAPPGPLDESLARELVDSLVAVRRALQEDLLPVTRTLSTASPDWGPGYQRAIETWQGIRNRVSERLREVHDAVRALERDTVRLTGDLQRAERLIDVIERSGSSFETPLGPLPVGVRELVFLYPAILGVAYFVCLAGFRRLVTLRSGYHELTARTAGDDVRADALPLHLTTPLWYDPLASLWPQLGRVILALAPLGVMLWSYFALRSGLAAVVSASESRFGPQWYDAFFWLTLVAVVVSLLQAVRVVARYAKAPPATPTR